MTTKLRNFILKNSYAFLILLLSFVILGYGFHSPDLLLLEDDIAGRYKAIQNNGFLKSQITIFKQWTMGRPVGHASNVTMQGIFLNMPESLISFFAVVAIALQSFFLRIILLKSGFSKVLSLQLALIFFVNPTSVSLFLPVHSFATELSTWFMLISIFFMLSGRPIIAAILASLQFATYETYATIFWLPLIFLGIQLYVFKGSGISSKTINKNLFSSFLWYIVIFFISVSFLIYVRSIMPSAGREAGIADMGLLKIVSQMLLAGTIGLKAVLLLQLDAISWSLKNGPNYVGWMAIFVPIILLGGLSLLTPTNVEPQDRLRAIHILFFLLIGLFIIFTSYMIYFDQRFPPKITISRLANIHSGSRFGLLFLFAGIIATFNYIPKFNKFFANIFLALTLTIGLIFQHSYGFQQAKSSYKKSIVVNALEYGCKNSNENDVIAIIFPAQLSSYKTDIIIGWTSPYIRPTTFEAFENDTFFITYNRMSDFINLMETSSGHLSQDDMINLSHFSFTKLKWLYPYGDISRWNVEGKRTTGVKVTFEPPNNYEFSIIGPKNPNIQTNKNCSRL